MKPKDRLSQATAQITAEETARLSAEHPDVMPSWQDTIRPAVTARILAECAADLPDPADLLLEYAERIADRADQAARDRSAHELRNPPLFDQIFSTIWDADGGRRSTALAQTEDLTANTKAVWDHADRAADAARRRQKLNDQRVAEMIAGQHRTFQDAVKADACPPIDPDDDGGAS